jgi:hypothetical protein
MAATPVWATLAACQLHFVNPASSIRLGKASTEPLAALIFALGYGEEGMLFGCVTRLQPRVLEPIGTRRWNTHFAFRKTVVLDPPDVSPKFELCLSCP